MSADAEAAISYIALLSLVAVRDAADRLLLRPDDDNTPVKYTVQGVEYELAMPHPNDPLGIKDAVFDFFELTDRGPPDGQNYHGSFSVAGTPVDVSVRFGWTPPMSLRIELVYPGQASHLANILWKQFRPS